MQIPQKQHGAKTNKKPPNPLRKLSKLQLLELLAQQERELQALRQELAEKEEALQNRVLQMEEAGSIAEAALRLNDVFEAAQRAADPYLESLRNRTEQPSGRSASAGVDEETAP